MRLDRKVILETSGGEGVNRIGGNMPVCFLNRPETVRGLDFYACLRHPFADGLVVSVFIPKEYADLSAGKIYPNCAVKAFVHEYAAESDDAEHRCKDLNRVCFADFVDDDNKEGVVQAGGVPQFIQDEDYYWADLQKDGYVFLMQIDEALYPDELVAGSYPFNFGALYLYARRNDLKQVVAGFWQNS